eukprot:Nk52_evm13s78 gene=Nk52_evmTU13s78
MTVVAASSGCSNQRGWKEVTLSCNAEETTAQVDTRCEEGFSVYQIDTLAYVSGPVEEDSSTAWPFFSGNVAANGIICCVVNKQIHIFEEECNELSATINLESEVEHTAWSDDSGFLVACDCSGQIHFIDVVGKNVLFSQTLFSSSETQSCNFARISFKKTGKYHTLCVLSLKGIVFRFANVDLDSLRSAIDRKDLGMATKIKDGITIEKVEAFQVHESKVCDACIGLLTCSTWKETPMLVVSGKGQVGISVWDISEGQSLLKDTIEDIDGKCGFLKTRLSADKKFLFCLSGDETLSVWDQQLMFKLFELDRTVVDFVLLDKSMKREESSQQLLFGETAKLVVLCRKHIAGSKAELSGTKMMLEIFSVPEMNFLYSTEVSFLSKLYECNNSLTDIYLMEGHFVTNSEGKKEQRLSVRTVSEKLPMERFYHLLHQKQFSDALKFSAQFKLDSEFVYVIKVGYLLEAYLSSASASIEPIVECLDCIRDCDWVVNFCLEAKLKTYDDTLRLLLVAKRVVAVEETEFAEDGAKIDQLCDVARAINRLGTFKMAFPGDFDGESWQLFRGGEISRSMCVCLSEGNIRSALILWKRHHIEDSLSNEIKNIVSAIPENLDSKFYLEWITNEVVPSIHCPEDRLFMTLWSEERAKLMEITESSDWPRNSLSLLNATGLSGNSALKLRASLTPREARTYIVDSFDAVDCTRDSSFDNEVPLSKLRLNLEDLCFLHEELDFKIGSAEYILENPTTIAFQLLDRVNATELLEDCIQNQVVPYLKRHSTDKDAVLFEYIVELMDSIVGLSTAMSGAAWETRVVHLIGFIENLEHKIDAVLEVCKRVNIPWSNEVETLMGDSMEWKHPRISELAAQLKLLKVRKLLLSYGLRECNVSDKVNVLKAVRRVISSVDKPEALRDALFVCSTHVSIDIRNCYIMRLQFLTLAGKSEEAIKLLSDLSASDVAFIGQQLVMWFCEFCSELPFDEDDWQDKIEMSHSALRICTALKPMFVSKCNRKSLFIDIDDIVQKLHIFRALTTEYEERVTFDICCSPCELIKILHRHVFYFIKENTNHSGESTVNIKKAKGKGKASALLLSGPSDTSPKKCKQKAGGSSYAKVLRLAELINYPRDVLKGFLAIESAKVGDFYRSFSICKELFQKVPDPSTAVVLSSVILATARYLCSDDVIITSNLKMHAMLPCVMKELAMQCTTLCNESAIFDMVNLFRSTEIMADILEDSDLGEYRDSVKDIKQKHSYKETDSTNMYRPKSFTQSETTKVHFGFLFESKFKEDSLVLSSSQVLPLIASASVQIFDASVCEQLDPTSSSFISESKFSGENDLPRLMIQRQAGSSLESLADTLLSNGSLGLAYQVILWTGLLNDMCMRFFNCKSIIEEGFCSGRLNSTCNSFLHKVLNSNCLDSELGVGVMLSLCIEKAFQAYRSSLAHIGHDYKRLRHLSAIGSVCGRFWQQRSFAIDCQQLGSNARWWEELKLLNINFDEKLFRQSKDGVYQRKLLPKLLRKTALDLTTCLTFCDTYNIDRNEALLDYIEIIYEQRGSNCDTRDQSYKDLIMTAICDIRGPSAMKLLFEKAIFKISPFDFDCLKFTFELLADFSEREDCAALNNPLYERGILLLDVLRRFDRVSEVHEFQNNWLSMHRMRCIEDASSCTANLIAERLSFDNELKVKRLPFHPILFEDSWKWVAPEINNVTVSKLLPLSRILKLQQDQFYVNAIQNMMKESQVSFHDLKSLFSQIKDFELCVVTLKWAADSLPLGHDKVSILQYAAQLASKWKTQSKDEDAVKAFERLSKLHCQLCAEHLLKQHDLSDKIFIDLISQPAELICQLYYLKGREYLEKKDDRLHDLVEEISSRSKLNPDKIRAYLLQKWLADPADKFCLSGDAKGSTEGLLNQSRILYLLRKGDTEKNISFLLHFSHQNTPKVTYLARFRAIQAVFSFASRQNILKVYGKSIGELGDYMQTLLFLARLDELNIKQSLSEFLDADKTGLAKGLWRNHNGNPTAVRLIADLCLDYNVYDVILWNSVLSQLLQNPRLDYLMRILPRISAVPSLSYLESVTCAWEQVLHAALAFVNHNGNTRTIGDIGTVVDLLESCPLLHEIDIPSFADSLLNRNEVEQAFRVLLLGSSPSECKAFVKRVLPSGHYVQMLNQLQPTTSELCPTFLSIRDDIFQYINEKKDFGKVVGTCHFKQFVKYLINVDDIDNLVTASLALKRNNDAEKLVFAYKMAYPSSPLGVYCAEKNLTRKDKILQAYLETRTIPH